MSDSGCIIGLGSLKFSAVVLMNTVLTNSVPNSKFLQISD